MNDILDLVMERVIARARTKSKPLEYPGGDSHIIDELLSALSYAPCKRCTLVEVFGGSGLVSQYAPRTKFKTIIYNDADKLLAEFYRMVKEDPELLTLTLSILPHSRFVYEKLRQLSLRHSNELESLLAAVILFYIVNSSETRNPNKSFVISREHNEALTLSSSILAILEASKNFRDVTIECLDFSEVIRLYDSEDTVFYLDPPYVNRQYYRLNFTLHQALKLSNMLNNIRGYYLLKIIDDQLQYYNVKYKSKIVLDRPLYLNSKFKDKADKQKIVLLSNYSIGLETVMKHDRDTASMTPEHHVQI